MRIICYGASNTYGYDPRSYIAERYERPWTKILEERLGETVVTEALNGRRIPEASQLEITKGLLSSHIREGERTLLLIMLGSNDLASGLDSVERMKLFLQEVKRWENINQILLIAPPYILGEEELYHKSVKMNEGFQKLAEEYGISFLDSGKWGLQMAHDGLHMSERDQEIFAEKTAEYIKKL